MSDHTLADCAEEALALASAASELARRAAADDAAARLTPGERPARIAALHRALAEVPRRRTSWWRIVVGWGP